MTRYEGIPKPIRAGIVVDPERGTPLRVIVLHFNPDTLQRSLAPLYGHEDSPRNVSKGGDTP